MVKKINLLFMGTNNFAREVLSTLLEMSEVNIVAVICQPDRKIGRKQTVIFSPVKELALAKDISLLQPEKIIQAYNDLQKLPIDMIITCAYGQFLPIKILSLAKILPLNIHASLLPKLRGGAPIQWAIINNFSETGITLMKMVQKMDAGAIFSQGKVKIATDETYHSLQIKLISLAKQMVQSDLLAIANGEIKSTEQNENEATFAFNITRTDELINWKQSAKLVSCQVRGLYDQPIAYSSIASFIYKVHQVEISKQVSTKMPGTITLINKLGIFVATNDFDIIITKIQPAGKTVINTNNYSGSKTNPLKVDLVFK